MLPYLPAYNAMMPVLKAQEALEQVTVTAVGSGSFKKRDSQRVIRAWTKVANKFVERKVIKPSSREEHHAMLKAFGVKVQGQ